MANDKARGDLATAGLGYTLAASGGAVSERGIRRLKVATGEADLHHRPATAMLAAHMKGSPATSKARLLYGGGRLLTAVGSAGAVHGTTSYFRDRKAKDPVVKLDQGKPEHHSLLEQGVEGNVKAVKEKLSPSKNTPLKAHVISLGLGAFGGGGASALAGKFTHKLPGPSGLRFPAKAVAGAAGLTASVPVANKINNHFKVKPRRKPVRPSTKASSVEARQSKGADQRQARASIVPLTKMDDPSEVHVLGALQPTGRKRARQPIPYEIKQSRRVKKLDNGMTAADARRQLQRKKRKLVSDVASTGLGLGGLALLGASHPASGLKDVHRARLARAAGVSAVLGGGVSGVNGVQGIKIAHHDIKSQQKVLAKAYGVPRIPGFRSSYLQTRRLRNGTLRAVRVNGGAVR